MTATSPSITLAAHPESSVRDYIALLKPRVMSLVVFSSWIGMLVAPGELHPFRAFITILMVALGSGAAGALNMWYDRDIDQHMSRTRTRPIPMGVIAPDDAFAFAIILAVFSVVILAFTVNYIAAFCLAFAIFYYVVIYTIWLKRRTPQNIVIGGAAGAFPPIIGWVAVTGHISLYPCLLFLIIFFWTCPHFWALALLRMEDYGRVRVPMLPNIHGIQATKHHILAYSFLTAAAAMAPYFYGFTGLFYAAASTILNSYLLWFSYKIQQFSHQSPRSAQKLFGYSIFYLFALFSALGIDHFFI